MKNAAFWGKCLIPWSYIFLGHLAVKTTTSFARVCVMVVLWCARVCIFWWQFHWDHRRPCPTLAAGDIANLVKSNFGRLRGLWSGCVGCLYMHPFWQFQWYHQQPCLTQADGNNTVFSQRQPYGAAITSSHGSGSGPLEPQWCHHNHLFSANVALFGRLNQNDCREKDCALGAAGERARTLKALRVYCLGTWLKFSLIHNKILRRYAKNQIFPYNNILQH